MTHESYKNILDLLLQTPQALAVWNCEEGNTIYVSDTLAKLLRINNTYVSAYNFSQAFDRLFEGFLNTASKQTLIKGTFSSDFNNLKVTLKYNKSTNTYLLTVTDAVRRADNDLEDILNALPIYVWKRDADLKLKYCNQKYADAFDTSPSEVIRCNMKLPIFTNSKGLSLEQLAISSGKAQTVRKHTIVNGVRKLFEISELPLNHKKQQIGYAIDVSDEDKIQNEYDIFKKQTFDALDHISVPIAICDADTKLSFFNKAGLQFFDLEESYAMSSPSFVEILGVLIDKKKITEAKDYQTLKNTWLRYFREIVAPHHEFMHTPDGRSINIVVSPHYGGGLIFVFEDITEKLVMERERNALFAVQKETIEHLHDGILVFGGDNKIRMMNPTINEIWETDNWGTNSSDLHIKDFFSRTSDLFISSDDCETWISQIISMSESRTESSGTIMLVNGKNIDYIYVPLPDGHNLIRFADVTDRRKLENALREKNDMMSQIDRLKSHFISNVSFELKSPINTISGFSDILINQYFGDLNERQLEYCRSILEASNKLADIIDAMLNLATIEAGHNKMRYKEIYLSEFLNELVKLFNDAASKKNVAIQTSVEESSLNAYCDEYSIKQVLFQITSLLLKITQIGETISIHASKLAEQQDYITISIKNTGFGMPRDELDNINKILMNDNDHKPNFSSSSDFVFLFAQHVAQLHEGRLSVESDYEAGTIITISIPANPPFMFN
ncbi:MAG: PAS-domain containing protein [Holosporales bacterium]|jgi:signal transduction histidine kinase|nr:PAS-domain containing protein [Holosporales bacterium]